MVYTWYIIYSIRWLVLWRRAGARARAYPPAGQRLHTVTQARPRARARAHVRTSARTRAREHLAVVRFPRPNSANTDVANEINKWWSGNRTKSDGEEIHELLNDRSKLGMPTVPMVLIFKITGEQEKNVCAVHTLPPTSGQWFPTHLCVHCWFSSGGFSNIILVVIIVPNMFKCQTTNENIQMPNNQRKYSNAKQPTKFHGIS